MRWARRAYGVIMVAALVYVVVTARADIAHTARNARIWVLVLVPVVAVGQLVVASAFWATALAGFGEPVGMRASLDATLGATPARYIPGSVWYAVGRVARLREAGARTQTLTTVAALEMVVVPVVAFAYGGLLMAVTSAQSPVDSLWIAAAALLLALAGSPPVVNLGLRVVTRFRGTQFEPLTWSLHVRLFGWSALQWTWAAGVFVLYLSAFPNIHGGGVVEVAGSFMVAWGVGWLAIFAPQGAGVFEATLAALLTGQTRAGLALVLGGYRAVIAVRDAVTFGAVLLARRRAARR